MANINLNQTEEIKKKVLASTGKGISYFFRNLLFVSLILLVCYIVTNLSLLMNPKEFFANFDISSVYVFAVLLFILLAIFQVGRNILKHSNADANIVEELENDKKNKKHREDLKKRFTIGPEISSILKDILIDLNASRATVCEMHNGTNSLGGVPFLYLSMNYEEISKEVEYSSEDFNNINMSRIPFIGSHFEQGSWIGSVEEIEQTDKFLATRLKLNKDNYLAFALIYGKAGLLGVLTIAFTDSVNHPTKLEINQQLLKASQRLSILLDGTR